MRDPFAAFSGNKSGSSRCISSGGAPHRKGERNCSIVPPFPESPRYLSPFQRNLFSLHCLEFHTEHRLTPRWHVGPPCGKASWESLVEEARGSRTHPEEPRFRLVARHEGFFPCLVGKQFWAFPSHLKRRCSPQERREEVKRRATIPRVPLMSQSIPEDLFSLYCLYFHDEDRLRPRWHIGQLCTKSSCETLEGNPRGKATDPRIDAMASVTMLPQIRRKAHVHAPSQEED
ncbi:hypothetical protein MJT46_018555 [Ovis ammon polii x Ovis aries]|nr:hypothetical protein MJT46_018555 [Ovis ammon polii x Ovis aries]